MSDINKEIDEMATDLAKSAESPKERLFATIRELGPAGIRAKLPTLEKAEQEMLRDALEEMKKAVEMDPQYQAKYVQGKLTDTKIQEDKADDDQDEKLVKEEAAKMNNQGSPTPGWEGQVIKGKNMKNGDEKKEKKMGEKMKDAVDEIAENEAKEEVESHEDKMHSAKKKIKSGKKDEMKDGLKMMKKAIEEKMGEKATVELVKGEMKRLLAEEDQEGDAPEMNEKTRANKENVAALNLGADNKEAQKKVNDEKQGTMRKAVWGSENDLLKANTGGRNFHFSLEEYVAEVQKEKPIQELKKSQGKEDLNDIIEKGGDRSMKHFETEKLMKQNVEKQNGKVVKSFADDEIAQALGLTEEEAKKILGEK